MKGKLFYNGTIITMEEEPKEVEAVRIENGKITRIGTEKELFQESLEEIELVDLQGKSLIPAFIDPHSHISAFAKTLSIAQLGEVTSFSEIVDCLKKYKKENNLSDTDWIIGFGYDHNQLQEKKHPDKKVLDQVSMTNPILITHQSGHMGVMNSKGLELSSIHENTKDPEGGFIGRESNRKEPNGYLEEMAFTNARNQEGMLNENQFLQSYQKAEQIYLQNGITTAQEGVMKEDELAFFELLTKNNQLNIDIVGYLDIKYADELKEQVKDYFRKYQNHFKIGGYKLFLDGSPQGRTAWLLSPYENEKDYRSYPIYTDQEVENFITKSLKERVQLLTHCNGDCAIEQLVNCFQKVVTTKHFKETCRPVAIHAQLARKEQLVKMQKLNMIPSFFVAHTYYWGDIHYKNLGKKRAEKISPVHTASQLGLVYTFHQDTPVIMPNMLETIWCSVNRITKSNVTIGAEEKISPYEALKAVTIHAAYQYFEENKKGSIKEGKNADLVILDQNPLTIDPMKIKEIKVIETIKDGITLYKRKG